MLRAKIFDGLGAGTFEGDGPDKKFVFRRDGDFKGLAVTGHVEDGFADDGYLANHADVVGTSRQDESPDFVVLADDATVGGPGGGLEFGGRVEGLQVAGEGVVAVEKLLLGGFESNGARGGRHGRGFGDGRTATAAASESRQRHPNQAFAHKIHRRSTKLPNLPKVAAADVQGARE